MKAVAISVASCVFLLGYVPRVARPISVDIVIGTNPAKTSATDDEVEAFYRSECDPSYSTPHDLACGYLFSCKTGTATGLLIGHLPDFGSTDLIELDDVWLEFDAAGILKLVEKYLVRKNRDHPEPAWREFRKMLSDPLNEAPKPTPTSITSPAGAPKTE